SLRHGGHAGYELALLRNTRLVSAYLDNGCLIIERAQAGLGDDRQISLLFEGFQGGLGISVREDQRQGRILDLIAAKRRRHDGASDSSEVAVVGLNHSSPIYAEVELVIQLHVVNLRFDINLPRNGQL